MARKPETIAFWWGEHLPHWEVVEGRYFVTMHLAGAIPQAGQNRIHELAREFSRLPTHRGQSRLTLHRRIYVEMERWLDRSDYLPLLQQPEIAEVIIEAITFRQGRVWNMFEYVVMPNHVHLFFEMLQVGLKDAIEQFKRWTAHKSLKILKNATDRFWQDEWFDHWSRSDDEDDRISRYIRQNPMKAGLVQTFEEWPYGSWRNQ